MRHEKSAISGAEPSGARVYFVLTITRTFSRPSTFSVRRRSDLKRRTAVRSQAKNRPSRSISKRFRLIPTTSPSQLSPRCSLSSADLTSGDDDDCPVTTAIGSPESAYTVFLHLEHFLHLHVATTTQLMHKLVNMRSLHFERPLPNTLNVAHLQLVQTKRNHQTTTRICLRL